MKESLLFFFFLVIVFIGLTMIKAGARREALEQQLVVVGVCERFGMQATNISCLVHSSGKQDCTYECWPVSQADDEE